MTMIGKIHYCWFGDKPLSEEAKKNIGTWKKFFPNYEVIEWNESNFNISFCDYTKEAYEQKKYAFVSDVARLYLVYEYGGIYMDTDVEVLRKFGNNILDNDAFFGLEAIGKVNTGLIFGANPKNWLVKKLLDDYLNRHFVDENGLMDETPCPIINSKIFLENGFLLRGDEIEKRKGVAVFPPDYFNPKSGYGREIHITNNTVSIHHFDGSWFDDEKKKRAIVIEKLCKKYGNKKGVFIYKTLYFPFRLLSHLKGKYGK